MDRVGAVVVGSSLLARRDGWGHDRHRQPGTIPRPPAEDGREGDVGGGSGGSGVESVSGAISH